MITETATNAEKAREINKVAESRVSLKGAERIDDLQRAGLKIIQDPERFCFGMDAVLLSHFAKVQPSGKVLDMGTGTGIIPILMSALSEASHLTGLEIQEESADMAARSIRLNGLEDRLSIVKGDIKEAGSLFSHAFFDVITCNPPYLQVDHGIVNPSDAKAIARHEVLCTLEDVISAATVLLKPGGHFYMVHRPFRLSEIMNVMHAHKLEPKRMRLVYPMADKEPNMVLIEGIRGANMRIEVEKPLILQNADGSYTDEVKEWYGF
ncbi:MAG: tRNA1(Val) (adenine(37)-N6)-methyltransferase [Lachnospiraceae bacterium]|nr:tRNA1(Val) (adenine(37)-N6)-methyltransferase [Lachnospiraceae bacterium]